MSEPKYIWYWNCRLPERRWQLCDVLVYGKMNSILVEFIQDGFKVVTSRYAVRKLTDKLWRKMTEDQREIVIGKVKR